MIASEGVFSRIYLMVFGGREIIVKSSEYVSFSTTDFHHCVQDYCISKICGAMGCGPTLFQSFGFDLIVFRKTIEFAMEKCSHVPKFCGEEYLQLLENLGVMHQYHIIHRDITPNNIMFSPSQGKNIFIDFNVSTIIGENTGEKTYTSF
jgi:serine/threonine protein kinase